MLSLNITYPQHNAVCGEAPAESNLEWAECTRTDHPSKDPREPALMELSQPSPAAVTSVA